VVLWNASLWRQKPYVGALYFSLALTGYRPIFAFTQFGGSFSRDSSGLRVVSTLRGPFPFRWLINRLTLEQPRPPPPQFGGERSGLCGFSWLGPRGGVWCLTVGRVPSLELALLALFCDSF